jgi:predicted dehydrogenase
VLADPDVDVVYVCLANHQHAEWAIRALEAGKHVLCEKPLAVDRAQAESMARAAASADRLLVEAVWCRWHPRFQRLAALASGGALGELVAIDSAFTFPADLTGNYRADPAYGGGALLDVGGYQVHGWLAMASGAVDAIRAHADRDSSGIDLTTTIEAVMAGRMQVSAIASFALPEQQHLTVEGSDATARMGVGSAFTTWREPSTLNVGDAVEQFAPVDAYQLMVEAVSDRVAGGDSWVVPLEESLRVASVLDAIRAASP